MRILEMLPMAFCAKTSEMEPTTYSTAPKHFGQQDVSLLLTGLSAYQEVLLRAKYAYDESCKYTSKSIFRHKALEEPEVNSWYECTQCNDQKRNIRQTHFNALCDFILDQHFAEERCRHCKGTGYTEQAQTEKTKCPKISCQDGRFVFNNSVIAKITNIPKPTIKTYRNTIIRHLNATILRHEMEAIDILNKNKRRLFSE